MTGLVMTLMLLRSTFLWQADACISQPFVYFAASGYDYHAPKFISFPKILINVFPNFVEKQ